MPDFSDKPTLRGRLVLLRPFGADDADVMLGAIDDPHAARLTGTHGTFTEQQVRQFYASRNEQPDRLDLAVEEIRTGDCVGEAVLNDWDPDNRSCNFRIMLTANSRDRGLGTEATRLVVGYGFEHLGLHRISLEVYAFNPRAQRAYEKVGFVVEGRLREALWWDGEWVDSIVMSMLEREWGASLAGAADPDRES